MANITYTALSKLELTQKLVDHSNALLHELTSRASDITLGDLEQIAIQPQVTMMLAQDGDDVVGMIIGIIAKTPLRKIMFIEETVVSPTHRGQGIGRSLTTKLLDYAQEQGVNEVDLTSNAKRTAAIQLYESLGFVKRDTNFFRLVL